MRIADAMRRGALSPGLDGARDIDLLAVDWFALTGRRHPAEVLGSR